MSEPLSVAIDDYLEGLLSDADAAALERAIVGDPAAAVLYAERVLLGQHLAERMRFEATPDADAIPFAEPADRAAAWAWSRPTAIAAALLIGGLIAAVVAAVLMRGAAIDADGSNDSRAPVGVVLDTSDAIWSTEPVYPGDDLTRRTMRLDAGRLEFTSSGGAAVTVHGPATLTPMSSNRVVLAAGLLRAAVPAGAAGFTVDGPRGWSVVDLGTRFDVEVAADGRMRVMVDEGRVLLRSPTGQTIELAAGDGRTIEADDRVIAPAQDAWLRWRLAIGQMRSDADLLALYDFEDDAKWIARMHGATVTAGRFGDQALSLTGDGYAAIDGPGVMSAFTLSAWVHADRERADLAALLMVHGWGEAGVHWQLEGGKPKLNVQGQPDFAASVGIAAERWQHVAATFDGPGGRIALYIDGERVAEHAIAPGSKAVLDRATIGAWLPQGLVPGEELLRGFDGRIDELAIYRRALDAGQIFEIYRGTQPHTDRRDDRGLTGKELEHGANEE